MIGNDEKINNWDIIINKMEEKYKIWKKFNMSIFGRTLIANTCIIPILQYVSYFGKPSKDQLKKN